MRPIHANQLAKLTQQNEEERSASNAKAQVAAEIATEIGKAKDALQLLVEMAPGLNRNPYVQILRVNLNAMWQKAALLK